MPLVTVGTDIFVGLKGFETKAPRISGAGGMNTLPSGEMLKVIGAGSVKFDPMETRVREVASLPLHTAVAD